MGIGRCPSVTLRHVHRLAAEAATYFDTGLPAIVNAPSGAFLLHEGPRPPLQDPERATGAAMRAARAALSVEGLV